jgi:hypothetical protein
VRGVLVISRFRGDDPPLRALLEEALAALAEQTGYVDGAVGRNVDDPTLWLLQTRWTGPGAYRRALSAYDVRVRAHAFLGQALDEPSAYEVVEPGEPVNEPVPRQSG